MRHGSRESAPRRMLYPSRCVTQRLEFKSQRASVRRILCHLVRLLRSQRISTGESAGYSWVSATQAVDDRIIGSVGDCIISSAASLTASHKQPLAVATHINTQPPTGTAGGGSEHFGTTPSRTHQQTSRSATAHPYGQLSRPRGSACVHVLVTPLVVIVTLATAVPS